MINFIHEHLMLWLIIWYVYTSGTIATFTEFKKYMWDNWLEITQTILAASLWPFTLATSLIIKTIRLILR
jgi:hypothetical protein